jgi:integrase
MKMENKTKGTINAIETILNGKRQREGKWRHKDLPTLMKEQRDTLIAFDRFNELEAHCSLGTRETYLRTLFDLGRKHQKPYETMVKEDIQTYFSNLAKEVSEGTVALRKANIKRFFTWLEWVKVNKDKPDEQKLDLKDVTIPYNVRWIKTELLSNHLSFEDLPSEAEILQIVNNVQKQRDRAYILVSWETGASPVEVLGMRIRDVTFNQYGATISFKPYVSRKTKDAHDLKTKYRERQIPIVKATADLQMWLTLHPEKSNFDAPVWWSQHGGKLCYNVAQANSARAQNNNN